MIVFDTEFTSWEGANARGFSFNGEFKEIIQIAAIRFERGRPLAEAETFNVLVKPVLNPQLSDYIQNLTGLSQARIEAEGLALQDALTQFKDFCGHDTAYSNGHDFRPIAESCALQKIIMPLDPLQMRTFHPELTVGLERYLGRTIDWMDYPSGRVYELLNLTLPSNDVHNALHDVYSLAAVLMFMAEQGQPIIGAEDF